MDRHRADSRPVCLADAVAALSEAISGDEATSDAFADAERFAEDLVEALGWDVDRTSPGRADLVRAVASIRRHMPGAIDHPQQLQPFADSVRTLAAVEIPDDDDPDVDREAVLRFSVLGTVLFEQVITSLRRLAHVDRLRELAGSASDGTGEAESATAWAPEPPRPAAARHRNWKCSLGTEHAVAMTTASPRCWRTQVTVASRVRAGDAVLRDDRFVEIERVRRAQGRKPAHGENLHLVGDGEVVRVNSLDPVRIRARR